MIRIAIDLKMIIQRQEETIENIDNMVEQVQALEDIPFSLCLVGVKESEIFYVQSLVSHFLKLYIFTSNNKFVELS